MNLDLCKYSGLVSLWFVIFSLFSVLSLARAETEFYSYTQQLAVGLTNGVYTIERENSMPPKHFTTETEAKAWMAEATKNPEIIKPLREYFQLFLASKADFAVRQLAQKENPEEYQSNSNFFSSVSTMTAWAFEETGNRVTIVTNLIKPEDAGPIAGLLQTAAAFHEELSTLGLSVIDWSSVKQVGRDQITGFENRGRHFDAAIYRDSKERITNIICNVNGTPPYKLTFAIAYNINDQILRTAITRSLGGPLGQSVLQYTVKNSLDLPQGFKTPDFWQGFTNSETVVITYDCALKKTTIRRTDGPIQEIKHGANASNGRLTSFFVVSLIILSSFFGVMFILRPQHRSKTNK